MLSLQKCSGGENINWVRQTEFWRYTVTTAAPLSQYTATLTIARGQPAPAIAAPVFLVLATAGACIAKPAADCAAAWEYVPAGNMTRHVRHLCELHCTHLVHTHAAVILGTLGRFVFDCGH